MSATDALTSVYTVHGIGVEVRCEDAAVLRAMDLRLDGFRGEAAGPGLRFDFHCTDAGQDLPDPAIDGRPVYDTPDGSLHYLSDGDVLGGELGGVSLRCEPRRGTARLYSPGGFTGRRLYLATHPLVTVSLMEMLERRGLFSVHAACLAAPDGPGVVIAGASGCGKSTLAIALARAGLEFLSDDVIFLAPGAEPGAVTALGFADAVGLTEPTVTRFTELRDRLDGDLTEGFPKRLGRIERLVGDPARATCEPRALVFPTVTRDRPSAIEPMTPGEALVRLVPDVLVTDPAATQAHLAALGALLQQVSCHRLRSGTDLDRAVELVRALV